jgi:ABC-type phosphate transport system substrate-binding protein
MKRLIVPALLSTSALLASGPAAADIYLISNSSLTLTPDEARDVFLGEKQLAGNVKIVPFDNSAAQNEFLSKVLHMDAAKYSTLWTKKGFREGLNAPAVKGSDLEVISNVKANPGGVGYVTAPPPGVNVIRKF